MGKVGIQGDRKVTTGIIIQVRMGSTRLPGKALMDLPKDHPKSEPALWWTIKACQKTGFQVIVATSILGEDDAIQRHMIMRHADVHFFRGSPDDVLDRLYQCAKHFKLDTIVRVTGDCPFVDPEVIRQVVLLHEQGELDYASNVDPPTWPDGLDVQVVTFEALERTHQEAKDPTDRDTVLQYIVRNRHKFTVGNLPCPIPGLAVHRWVLDHEADYVICSLIASRLLDGALRGSMSEILAIAPKPQDNDLTGRNERYLAARTIELRTGNDFPRNFAMGSRARVMQPYGASTYSKSYVAWGLDNFGVTGNAPLYVTHAQGSRVFDVDGNELIDMTAGLGTTVLGHCDPYVRAEIEKQLDLGIGFPLAHMGEHHIGRMIMDRALTSDGHKIVFGKNGSDVTSAAVRLARVATGRKIITKLSGGYHGWHDWTLAGSVRDGGVPIENLSSVYRKSLLPDGYPDFIDTFDRDAVLQNSAALILEPDMVPAECLGEIIDICRRHGTLVIFDEMVTAFRYPKCTVAASFGLKPDMVCLGKALGNGMPITAMIGRADIMDKFVAIDNRSRYAFYSGTHFGEMLSLAAASAVVSRMDHGQQDRLCHRSTTLNFSVGQMLKSHQELNFNWKPGFIPKLQFYDPTLAAQFRREMVHNGVLFYAAMMPTLMHTVMELDHVVGAMEAALNAVKSGNARGKAAGNHEKIMRS
jgi:glutamate-1-semialdehyde 2,1-aminomutase/spore coat polysaccharide biosynthesis protein SpsF